MKARKKKRTSTGSIAVQLPKTAQAAARAGHETSDFKFSDASTAEKKNSVLVRTAPAPGGGTIVCYYDPETDNYDICHIVK